jgi:hypothetical protein
MCIKVIVVSAAEDFVQGEASTKYFQLLHCTDSAPAICSALWLSRLLSPTSHLQIAKASQRVRYIPYEFLKLSSL